MSKIMVIIPTYNHHEMINDIVYQTIDTYNGELFEFEIHDSSTNDETKNIIEAYNKLNKRNIKYFRYESNLALDEKCKIAIENNKLDFYILLGDGNLYNFNNLELQLKNNVFEKFNVINLEPLIRKKINKDCDAKLNSAIEYENPIKYIKYYSHLTYFGGAIYKTNFIRETFDKSYYKKCREDNLSWWTTVCIYNQLMDYKKQNISTLCSTLYVDGLNGNSKKKDHSWADKEKYFILTFKVFNKDVDLLYSEYDNVKKEIVKTFRDDSLASKRYLIQKRLNKDINIKLVKKYKKDIKYVHGYYGFMIFICLVPVFVIKLLKKLYKIIKR